MAQDRLAKFTEVIVDGRRLGRHVEHDAQSRKFPIPVDMSRTLRSVDHQREIPILDQGNLGSCTGNAGTGLLGTEPFYSEAGVKGLQLDEKFAIQLYSDATVADGYPGNYPPDDTGSSGLAIGKVLKKRGLISSYRHAFGLLHALQALQRVPVIIGIPWFASFDEPGSNGLLTLKTNSPIRGGHELEVSAIEVTNGDPNDPQGYIRIPQSWGTSWGDNGWCMMDFSTFGTLLQQQGDVMSFHTEG